MDDDVNEAGEVGVYREALKAYKIDNEDDIYYSVCARSISNRFRPFFSEPNFFSSVFWYFIFSFFFVWLFNGFLYAYGE